MLFLVLLALLSLVSASYWSKPTQKPHSVLSEFTNDGHHSLNQEELDALFLNPSSSDLYPRKPECFRRAAGYMRAQCSRLELDEDMRVRIAISMTLCELATARNHSPPMECRPFVREFSDTPQGTRDCVEALSRSAQFWSSYSGYLRETTQLCFAFQRWHDVDTAKAIYYNVTLEKVALLHLMMDRERRSSEDNQQMKISLEVMDDLLTLLRESSKSINNIASDATVVLHGHLQKTMDKFMSMMSDLYKKSDEDRSNVNLRVQSRVDHMFTLHERSLTSLGTSLEAAFLHHLDDTFHVFLEQNRNITDLTDAVKDARVAISADMVIVRESLTQVLNHVNHITDLLHVQSQLALITQQAQLAAAHSAEDLVTTVTQLTTTARLELESINETAVAIRENLMANNALSYWLPGPVLLDTVSAIFKVDFSYLNDLFQYPMFRVIAVIVRLFGGVLHIMFSAMMSAIFFSSRKWFSHNNRAAPSSKCASAAPIDVATSPQLAYYTSTQHVPQTRSRFRPRISRIPDRLLRRPAD